MIIERSVLVLVPAEQSHQKPVLHRYTRIGSGRENPQQHNCVKHRKHSHAYAVVVVQPNDRRISVVFLERFLNLDLARLARPASAVLFENIRVLQ